MEAERVKTKKVSAADRIPEKTGRKKWSVLFLESLLKEAKEREAESEKARPAVDGESWIRPGRDTFEHSEDPEELWCESYEDIMGIVRMVAVEIHHEIVAGGVRFVNNAWNAHTDSLYTR